MTGRQISGRTQLLGILVASPAHVQAPPLVNNYLADRGVDAVMVPMQVSESNLAGQLDALRGLENFVGAIVAMPHKTTVVPMLDQVHPTARLCGSVNALRRHSDGSLEGANFDGEGFVNGLAMGGIDCRQMEVLMVGAGGSGRSIAFALLESGIASLTIVNRTAAVAQSLALDLLGSFPDATVSCAASHVGLHVDLAVNVTSLGMHDDDSLPFQPEELHGTPLIADIVAPFGTTALVQSANAAGLRTHAAKYTLLGQVDAFVNFAFQG